MTDSWSSRAQYYNYISGFWYIAGVCGSTLGSLLLNDHVYLLNGISIGSYALVACVALFIPSHCGLVPKETQNSTPLMPIFEDGVEDNTSVSSMSSSREVPIGSDKLSLFRLLVDSWYKSYKSLLTLFSVAQPTSTVLVMWLLDILAAKGEVLLPQYASLVLSWPLATVNRVLAVKDLTAAVLLFCLPSVRAIFLEPRMSTRQIDLFIIQISFVASALGFAGLSISGHPGTFILSLCVYMSGGGLEDSLTAFGALTLNAGEDTTEFYVRVGLLSTLASLVGGPLWSLIFSIILKNQVFPLGFVYLLCASLFAAGLLGMGTLRKGSSIGL
ncbi:hypothetical protein ACLMJK_001078 [Lecanora helva]